ncbi:hypothetical protein [Crocinitomix algicola]|uniref:hypothetical protein n=1 Tax=Crocinitomix algicola TaxID=1740263 RepID=UPI0008721376|nr:hypothetical protein [Crocinitomix algicola]
MKKETAQDKKIKELLNDLTSSQVEYQVKAVKGLKQHGNESVIVPLLDALLVSDSDELNAEIIDLLNTTKSTKVPNEVAKALMDNKYFPLRHTLLTTIWNSGLDYKPYLREIVTVGTEGEMMEALECITIIENLEGELTEDQLFEPLLVLTEYIGKNRKVTGPKMDMIKEITVLLQEMNNRL